jgi:hypothetical protein
MQEQAVLLRIREERNLHLINRNVTWKDWGMISERKEILGRGDHISRSLRLGWDLWLWYCVQLVSKWRTIFAGSTSLEAEGSNLQPLGLFTQECSCFKKSFYEIPPLKITSLQSQFEELWMIRFKTLRWGSSRKSGMNCDSPRSITCNHFGWERDI